MNTNNKDLETNDWQDLDFNNEENLLLMLKKMGPLIQQYQDEKNLLLKDDKVNRYLFLEATLKECQKFTKKLNETYENNLQNNCQHNLWYLLKSEKDSYENRRYWTCYCLECGFEKEDRSRHFNNVIHGNGSLFRPHNQLSFAKVQQDYRILLDKYDTYYDKKNLDVDLYNQNVVAKVFVKKYKNI